MEDDFKMFCESEIRKFYAVNTRTFSNSLPEKIQFVYKIYKMNYLWLYVEKARRM